MLHIFVDADACPVKDEVYRVAERCSLKVTLVVNSWMRIPDNEFIKIEVVGGDLDEADDWIADQAQAHDIVITGDILLAQRCLQKQVRVIGTTGKSFTEESIGDAVATRNLMAELREGGEITGGPAPFNKKHRSQFLQELDQVIQSIRRNN